MTARSATQSPSPTDIVSAQVFEPPDQLEGGTGLYRLALRCEVNLGRGDVPRTRAPRVTEHAVPSRGSEKPAQRR